MTTKTDIFNSLKNIGAPRNSVVIIHCSLKSIGEIEGGGQGLLDALIEYFTLDGGILCIPTHTWAWQDDKSVPTLDLCAPRSNIGALPTLAANDARGVRTLHPTHSMAVFGEKSAVADFVKGEEKVETTTSPKGCYGKIYSMGGFVLLLGVGQNKNTFLHCVEEMLNVPNRISSEPVFLTVKNVDGSVTTRKLYPLEAKGIDDVSVNFPNYEPAFRYHGCIKDGFLGNAKIQLCDARKMKDVMETIFVRSCGKEMLYDLTPIDEKFYK